eukprot:5070202-Prymnesium_polylepis.1
MLLQLRRWRHQRQTQVPGVGSGAGEAGRRLSSQNASTVRATTVTRTRAERSAVARKLQRPRRVPQGSVARWLRRQTLERPWRRAPAPT